MKEIDWPVLREYRGKNLRRIRMPLGGIGTGKVSLCGTGGLRSFEIRNAPEKDFTPCRESVCPAFVLRVEDASGVIAARLLEGPVDTSEYEGCFGCAAPNHGYPRFASAVFKAAYPLAQVELNDPSMPIRATLEAMNPLVKGDAEASGMPVALLRWRLVNIGSAALRRADARPSRGRGSGLVRRAGPRPCGGRPRRRASGEARRTGGGQRIAARFGSILADRTFWS